MNAVIITKTYEEPPFCEKEILRYAGCKSSDEELLQLLRACIEDVRGKLSYKICYRELSVAIIDNASLRKAGMDSQNNVNNQDTATFHVAPICDFGHMKVSSVDLAKSLQGCERVLLFAATIGVEIDRLITKYSRISPSKALMFQAIGAERIEALCDAFCDDMKTERPRFSPGYGDLPLEVQRDIFQLLDCSKRIGISLNDSLLMSPSKSVTAFVGLADSDGALETTGIPENTEQQKNENKCASCNKTDCAFRGI